MSFKLNLRLDLGQQRGETKKAKQTGKTEDATGQWHERPKWELRAKLYNKDRDLKSVLKLFGSKTIRLLEKTRNILKRFNLGPNSVEEC